MFRGDRVRGSDRDVVALPVVGTGFNVSRRSSSGSDRDVGWGFFGGARQPSLVTNLCAGTPARVGSSATSRQVREPRKPPEVEAPTHSEVRWKKDAW
jgi:hypothetical protein